MRWQVNGVVWRRKLFVGRGLRRGTRQGVATKDHKEPKVTEGGAFFSRQDAKTRSREGRRCHWRGGQDDMMDRMRRRGGEGRRGEKLIANNEKGIARLGMGGRGGG